MFLKYVLPLTFFISSVGFCGTASSGGGKSVVCRDGVGKIKTIELLDLFESATIYGLKTKSFGSTLDENLEGAKNKISGTRKGLQYKDPITNWIDQAKHDLRILPPDVTLEPVNDAAPIALPKGCVLEQLAYYEDNSDLLVDRNLWTALDETNRAALLAHEAIYRYYRLLGDTDSRRARKVVAHIFSEFKFVPLMDGVPDNAISCYAQKGEHGDSFEFVTYDDPHVSNGLIIQFKVIRNQVPYSKTIMESPKWPFGPNDVYLTVQSAFENYDGITLRRTFDSSGNIQGYFFDDDDGKYLINCK